VKKLKSIAFITPEVDSKFGGQNGLTYDLIQHLKEKYHITVFAQRISHELQMDSNITWKPIPTKGPAILRFITFPILASVKVLLGKFDLIVCTGANCLFFDINVIHFLHAGLKKTCEDLNFKLGFYQSTLLRLNRLLEKLCYRRDKFYLGVSEKITHELQTLLKLPHAQTLWNTTTTLHSKPQENTRSTQAHSLITRILFTGDLKRNIKNIQTLIDALRQLNPAQYELWICSSNLPNSLRHKLQNIPHHYLGYCADMATIYREVDILVHPCIYEPFGLVVYEAWLAGLKIICSNANYVGAVPLIEKDPQVWLLDNPLDTAALAQSLKTAINHPPKARSYETWQDSVSLQTRYELIFNQVFSEISTRKT
jgi:glycosyltransferase involved in cell wall biosynthesis